MSNKLRHLLLIIIGIWGIIALIGSGSEDNDDSNPTLSGLSTIVTVKAYYNEDTGVISISGDAVSMNIYSGDAELACSSVNEDVSDASKSLYVILLQSWEDVEDTSRCGIGSFEELHIYLQTTDGRTYELNEALSDEEQSISETVANEVLTLLNFEGTLNYCPLAIIKINEPSETKKIGLKIIDNEGNYSAMEWLCFEWLDGPD